jgi:hypothetical protein
MTNSSAGLRFARFRRHLIVALCGMVFATLLPRWSSAQAIAYYDFNTPQANPSQTSTNCASIPGGPAASSVLFCFNSATAIGDTDGLSYISDSSYTSVLSIPT